MTFQTAEINGKTVLLATNPEVTALLAQLLIKLRELRERRRQR